MHAAYEQLMSSYDSDSSVLIASADCQTKARSPGTGASLCSAEKTSYFPHLVYGTAGNLQAYSGNRDYATLKAFVDSHKGPSPGPSPPSPPAPPSPPSPPSPSQSHYEHPPCQSDEVEVQVQGISGVMCSPSCTSAACPSDVPAGVSAQPKCILQDSSSGKKYCALQCSSDGDCDKAGGAACQPLQSIGLCTYPQSQDSWPPTCPMITRPTNASNAVVV